MLPGDASPVTRVYMYCSYKWSDWSSRLPFPTPGSAGRAEKRRDIRTTCVLMSWKENDKILAKCLKKRMLLQSPFLSFMQSLHSL